MNSLKLEKSGGQLRGMKKQIREDALKKLKEMGHEVEVENFADTIRNGNFVKVKLEDGTNELRLESPKDTPPPPPLKKEKRIRIREEHVLENMAPFSFDTPPCIRINDYWTYYAVPQKLLFHDLLRMENVKLEKMWSKVSDSPPQFDLTPLDENYDESMATLARQRIRLTQALKSSNEEERISAASKLAEMETQISNLESEHQRIVLQRSLERYSDTQNKDANPAEVARAEQDVHNRTLANMLRQIQTLLQTYVTSINKVQAHVLETEIPAGVDQVGGEGGSLENAPETAELENFHNNLSEAMEIMGETSTLKGQLKDCTTQVKTAIRTLQRHLPGKKHAYHKSGEFTKAKRAIRLDQARPYNKTGKHIHDYQTPRFAERRDEQIQLRAKQLKLSAEAFQYGVLGRGHEAPP